MQTQPSPEFLQILSLLPKLEDLERNYLFSVLRSYPGVSLDPEDLQIMPSGEDLARRALKILRSESSLTGPENALLAAVLIQHGAEFGLGAANFDSRTVTQELRREGRPISNITTVMDSLLDKGFVEIPAEFDKSSKGTHREYVLTSRGLSDALRLCRREEDRPPSTAATDKPRGAHIGGAA